MRKHVLHFLTLSLTLAFLVACSSAVLTLGDCDGIIYSSDDFSSSARTLLAGRNSTYTLCLGFGLHTGCDPEGIEIASTTGANTFVIGGLAASGVEIDCQGNGSLFQVAASDFVFIQDITIINATEGSNGQFGSAVRIDSSAGTPLVSLSNVNVHNSTHSAVLAAAGNLVVSSCGFYYNDAGGFTANTYGGAVYVRQGGIATVEDSVFVGNSAYNGGAMAGSPSGSSTINVYNSTFLYNYGGTGGGIYLGHFSYCEVYGSYFSLNTVYYSGGAIRMNLETVIVKNGTELTRNRAMTGSGGAFWSTLGDYIELDDVVVTDNTANDNGGGINVGSCVLFVLRTSHPISGNSAEDLYGGGVHIGYSTSIIGAGVVIEGNTATVAGGGLFIEHTDPDGCNFEGALTVRDNSCSSGTGGVHFSWGAVCNITTPFIVTGNRGGQGGGVRTLQTARVFLHGSYIVNNTATLGAGIYVQDNSELTAIDCLIANNIATADGGGVYNDIGVFNLVGTSSIAYNSASGLGGGIYSISSHVTLSGYSTVTANRAVTGGSGVYFKATGALSYFTMNDDASVNCNYGEGDVDSFGAGVLLDGAAAVGLFGNDALVVRNYVTTDGEWAVPPNGTFPLGVLSDFLNTSDAREIGFRFRIRDPRDCPVLPANSSEFASVPFTHITTSTSSSTSTTTSTAATAPTGNSTGTTAPANGTTSSNITTTATTATSNAIGTTTTTTTTTTATTATTAGTPTTTTTTTTTLISSSSAPPSTTDSDGGGGGGSGAGNGATTATCGDGGCNDAIDQREEDRARRMRRVVVGVGVSLVVVIGAVVLMGLLCMVRKRDAVDDAESVHIYDGSEELHTKSVSSDDEKPVGSSSE